MPWESPWDGQCCYWGTSCSRCAKGSSFIFALNGCPLTSRVCN